MIRKIFRRKYPIIPQYDQIDCGPAALLSVLKYYGGDSTLVYIRERCKVTAQGTSILETVNAAKELGFDAYGAKGEYEDLIKEKMPCIAHVAFETGLNHFVVIYKISSKYVWVGDPGKGKYRLSKEAFINIWKQKAVILLKPKDNLYHLTSPSWHNWIMGYIKKQESWVVQTLFLGIVYTIIGLLTAIFVRLLIDRFIPEKDYDKIIYTGLFLLALLIIRALAGYFRQRFLIILNKRINVNINSDFLGHVFRIPKSFFDTRKTGDITARINDSMIIQQAILLVTNTTIIDGLIIIGSFILMFYLTPILAWMCLIMIPFYAWVLFSKIKRIKNEQNEVMKGHAKVESSYIDSLKGIDDILGFNVSKPFTRLNKILFEFFQTKIEEIGYTRANLSLSAELSSAVLTIFLLTVGAVYVIRDKLMLGQLMASYSLLVNILPAINRFVEANIALQGANVAAQRLRDILLVNQEKNDGKLLFKMKKKLTILNGFFSWPRSQPLFKGISLSLESGKLVSLWGRSGTGKSTLVQIFQRKYFLSEGQIFVDEIPAEQFDLENYRKSIGVVPQIIKLFNGTILENITVGREIKNYDEVIQKIEKLDLSSFIARFDEGLFTLLGEEGRKLSGGEMQMLALLRALYHDPEILIIDEGFSGMDVEIEDKIFKILKKYAKDHAVLLITHALRMISKSDYVYILENGLIVEEGHPEELALEEHSYFNNLLDIQEVNYKMGV